MNNTAPKGFSIIELIVTMSIFVMITGVLLVNYNSINQRLSLDTLVHQMAQWVRETQVSAMSVRSRSGGFDQGYGLHFDQASVSQFFYFADLPGGMSKRYDPLSGGLLCGDATVECMKTITLQRKSKISRICGFVPPPAAVTYQGTCPANFDELDTLDIVFTRPNPDAEITGTVAGTPISYGNVVISVSALGGYTRSVSVWTTGQVTVQ